MSNYGYRVALFRLTEHYKPSANINFDHSQLGKGGLRSRLLALIKDMKASSGDRDDRESDFLRVDDIAEGGWLIVPVIKGGDFGEALDVVDVRSNEDKDPISPDYALLRKGTIVLVVPPDGEYGVVIAETVGNRSHLVPFIKRLSYRLRLETNHVLRLDSEIADSVAWSKLLDRKSSHVSELVFVAHELSSDHTQFRAPGVKTAELRLNLLGGSKQEKAVSRALKKSVKAGTPTGLLGLLNVGGAEDDQFEEQKAVIVEDGARRTISVGGTAPRFVYLIDSAVKLEVGEFLKEIRPAVEDTLAELNVERAPDWWLLLKQ